ncbi:M28 family peptidase [Aureivirga sp. CE67]|uniref:M28 family peptidase n=1 Tax=Aureivirga sp. CE67 TaxID=1788983 RepID=UPI0018C98E7F|nr:M28 family peptidase [Aureivirga sp. CE67]
MKQTYFSLLFFSIFSLNLFSQTSTSEIENHLDKIINTEKPRNYKNVETLNEVSQYIYDEFCKNSAEVKFQDYKVNKNNYRNVIAYFGPEDKKTIVIGAHYDVCGDQDGADDNASGVVGLLELSRLLKNEKLNYRVELVAYSLEEPPFFRTKNMGSYIHAASLKKNKIDVFGMISLEMIGYFDNKENSQSYPSPEMKQMFGTKADFITVVSNDGESKFNTKFMKHFVNQNIIKAFPIVAPSSVQGIDFSDHLNYWKFGFNAVMITDTAFFRNKNYHEHSDTIETLDINKMSKVIDNLYQTLIQL